MKIPFLDISHLTGVLNSHSKRLIYGNLINSVGAGLTISLYMVYLTTIRDYSISFAGFALAWAAIVGLIVNPVIGIAIDNLGARIVIIVGLFVRASAAISLAFVHNKFEVLAVATLTAIGDSSIWPAQSTALTRVTAEEDRTKVFSLNFMMLNLGFGIGSTLTALIVQAGNLKSFQILYVFDGITFFLYLLLVLTLPKHVGKRENHEEKPTGTYSQIFKNKPLMKLSVANLIMVSSGYSAAIAGLPLFIVEVLKVSPKWLGVIWGANTLLIVLAQPRVSKWLEKTHKLKALVRVGFFWALSWLVAGLSGWAPIAWIVPMQIAGSVIFGFGETIWSPAGPALVNEMAPDEVRGRANSLMSLQWSVAGIIGPLFVGLMLNAGHPAIWITVVTLGCLAPIPLLMSIKLNK